MTLLPHDAFRAGVPAAGPPSRDRLEQTNHYLRSLLVEVMWNDDLSSRARRARDSHAGETVGALSQLATTCGIARTSSMARAPA
jgi:hypothetical protein